MMRRLAKISTLVFLWGFSAYAQEKSCPLDSIVKEILNWELSGGRLQEDQILCLSKLKFETIPGGKVELGDEALLIPSFVMDDQARPTVQRVKETEETIEVEYSFVGYSVDRKTLKVSSKPVVKQDRLLLMKHYAKKMSCASLLDPPEFLTVFKKCAPKILRKSK